MFQLFKTAPVSVDHNVRSKLWLLETCKVKMSDGIEPRSNQSIPLACAYKHKNTTDHRAVSQQEVNEQHEDTG